MKKIAKVIIGSITVFLMWVMPVCAEGEITAEEEGIVEEDIVENESETDENNSETVDSEAEKVVVEKVKGLSTMSVTEKKIKLTWERVTNASGYHIYRSSSKGKTGKLYATVKSGKTLRYYDKDVKVGKTYYYTIEAYRKADGDIVCSKKSRQVSQKAQLAASSIKKVENLTYNQIRITWSKVENADGYYVYRSTSKNGEYKRIETVKGAKKTSYTDEVPECGERYYYKIAAYCIYSSQKYSGQQSGYKSGRTVPETTHFEKESYARLESMTLFWEAAAGADGYEIYRSTKSKSGFTKIKTISKDKVCKWTNTGLNKNKVYYYKIRPFALVDNKKIYGPYSRVMKKVCIMEKVEYIQKYVYVRYVSGGTTTKGWDCSGFTQWALDYIYGVSIPKHTSEQANSGVSVNKYDMSKWQPGDILVYSCGGRINHVALYIGDGKLMHALNSKYDTIIQGVEEYEAWDKRNNLCRVRRCF